MPICAKIGANIVRNCSDKPILGIEQRLILINTDDLKKSNITLDTTLPSSLITNIAVDSGKTGYEIEGFKQVMNYSNSLETAEDTENGIIHSITGIRLFDPSEQAREQLNLLVGGANVYAVVERKWKGTSNNYAFLFFGYSFGLEISEYTDNSNENDGTITFSLATPSGYKEPYAPRILRITDYATTATAFGNKFAG